MIVKLPAEKADEIKKLGLAILSKNRVSARELASYIGLLVAALPAILFGKLYYKYLEMD